MVIVIDKSFLTFRALAFPAVELYLYSAGAHPASYLGWVSDCKGIIRDILGDGKNSGVLKGMLMPSSDELNHSPIGIKATWLPNRMMRACCRTKAEALIRYLYSMVPNKTAIPIAA